MRPASSTDTTSVNAFGFNDVDHSANKAEGVTRLALVGDSFVFGVVPRPKGVAAVVQRLADDAGEHLEVLNMGIPGAGPKNYLRLIGKDVVDERADVVGVVVFLGNDVVQAHRDFDARIWLGDVREVLVNPFQIGWSTEYLAVFRMARATARVLRERSKAAGDSTFSKESFVEIEAQRAVVFETTPSGFVRDSYSSLIEIVRQMQATAHAHGVKLFVVLAPDQIQVEDTVRAEVFRAEGLNGSGYDFEGLPHRLEQELEASGIPTLNLLPVFRGSQQTGSLYLKQDSHWNEAGNALAGEAIREFMRARDLR